MHPAMQPFRPAGQLEALRRFDRDHPQLADAVAVALLFAASSPWLIQHGRDDSTAWLCDAGLLVPLIWRRSHPVAAFTVIAAAAFAQWCVGIPLVTDVALLAALATVASECPRVPAVASWAVLEVGVVMASVRWHFTGSWVRSLTGLSGLAAVALLSGIVVRARRAHLAELTERAARLELERDQQAQIAAAAERTRIAREMHDVIAHSLAVMITMADGASAKLRRDPERAGAAIEAVAQVGRQALGETRRLLGVLRDPGGGVELAPQPGLGGLGELVEHLRDAGLDANLAVSGSPLVLTPGAELAVYRIVQEATTNTLKHATGARSVDIDVHWTATGVEVRVTDDGVPEAERRGAAANGAGGPAPAGVGAAGQVGHGIEGMRERVALYGGTLAAGPRPAGGWAVTASFDAPSGGGTPVAPSPPLAAQLH